MPQAPRHGKEKRRIQSLCAVTHEVYRITMIEIKCLPQGKALDVEMLESTTMPESLEPHRHDYYEIFWTLSGTGSHSIDFTEYPLSPGLLYCIAPGQVHDCHCLPEQVYAISFNAECIHSDYRSQHAIEQLFRMDHLHYTALQIDTLGQQELQNILAIIARELQQPSFDSDLLSIFLTGFLRYLTRYLTPQNSDHFFADERVMKLLSFIDTYFCEHKETDFYSDKLALTNKRVNELTKQYLSKTVTQLIHDRVILEARRQLAFTMKTVKAVALDLGYMDTAYFCRFFRRRTGESPNTFRKRW